MNSTFTVIALAVVAIAILLLLSGRFRSSGPPRRSHKAKLATGRAERSSTQWRAVKIEPGLMCCGQAGALAGKVFLSKEAPQLPLEGCSETDCRCKYVHLEDRRVGDDRRVELGDLGAFLPVTQQERRRVAGRRSEDLAA
jgi:hypothetical protein